MAYVLGFFAADGTMIKNTRGAHFIEFHITDFDLLKEIQNLFSSNHAITRSAPIGKNKAIYKLQLGSKEMYADLAALGFESRKSNILTFPHVPDELMPDFIRGYFDGDGCVSFTKIYRKDRNMLDWSFTTRFTSGSKKFLLELHRILLESGLKGGYLYKKQRGFELVFSRRDSLALFYLIYNNGRCPIYLRRKKKIFIAALKKLGYAE
ncbi:MAG TPA: LAGLIDADG family homing endonuclease [Candidatus Paceibacterota bacterium]|nr:LAGLIDADG family homing endonuclease [Candidatus Paceibacterota bacterium]